jgi:hypothetical protein
VSALWTILVVGLILAVWWLGVRYGPTLGIDDRDEDGPRDV